VLTHCLWPQAVVLLLWLEFALMGRPLRPRAVVALGLQCVGRLLPISQNSILCRAR
jgi:hypothetical protein